MELARSQADSYVKRTLIDPRRDASGIRSIIDRLSAEGPTLSTERLVTGCLELIGGYELLEDTRSMLMNYAEEGGPLQPGTPEFSERVGQMLQLIVSTQEYQFT